MFHRPGQAVPAEPARLPAKQSVQRGIPTHPAPRKQIGLLIAQGLEKLPDHDRADFFVHLAHEAAIQNRQAPDGRLPQHFVAGLDFHLPRLDAAGHQGDGRAVPGDHHDIGPDKRAAGAHNQGIKINIGIRMPLHCGPCAAHRLDVLQRGQHFDLERCGGIGFAIIHGQRVGTWMRGSSAVEKIQALQLLPADVVDHIRGQQEAGPGNQGPTVSKKPGHRAHQRREVQAAGAAFDQFKERMPTQDIVADAHLPVAARKRFPLGNVHLGLRWSTINSGKVAVL